MKKKKAFLLALLEKKKEYTCTCTCIYIMGGMYKYGKFKFVPQQNERHAPNPLCFSSLHLLLLHGEKSLTY